MVDLLSAPPWCRRCWRRFALPAGRSESAGSRFLRAIGRRAARPQSIGGPRLFSGCIDVGPSDDPQPDPMVIQQYLNQSKDEAQAISNEGNTPGSGYLRQSAVRPLRVPPGGPGWPNPGPCLWAAGAELPLDLTARGTGKARPICHGRDVEMTRGAISSGGRSQCSAFVPPLVAN
jgi:hypothetical protein